MQEAELEAESPDQFKPNDFVCVNGKKYGYLRYIGASHFLSGITCGGELIEAYGKHDGEKDQIRLVKITSASRLRYIMLKNNYLNE